jgi:hypothetical protein
MNYLVLMKVDTSLLDRFSGIITLIVALGMILVVGRCLWQRAISSAILSLVVCGLLLWAVNSLSTFMNFITVLINFTGSVFGG